MAFTEYLLGSRHHARGFICLISFNPAEKEVVTIITPTLPVGRQLRGGEVAQCHPARKRPGQDCGSQRVTPPCGDRQALLFCAEVQFTSPCHRGKLGTSWSESMEKTLLKRSWLDQREGTVGKGQMAKQGSVRRMGTNDPLGGLGARMPFRAACLERDEERWGLCQGGQGAEGGKRVSHSSKGRRPHQDVGPTGRPICFKE